MRGEVHAAFAACARNRPRPACAGAGQGSNADGGHYTTRLENTHGTEFRELLYPWHPWFGLRVGVNAAIERSNGIVFRCNLSGSNAHRSLEIPAWMFDRVACANVRVAVDAHPDLAALTALAVLLRHVPNDRLASLNAPLSGVSNLSDYENQGDVHATADEAETRAPTHTATNRPVRRSTAEDDGRYSGSNPAS
jgi:hypothetical protein